MILWRGIKLLEAISGTFYYRIKCTGLLIYNRHLRNYVYSSPSLSFPEGTTDFNLVIFFHLLSSAFSWASFNWNHLHFPSFVASWLTRSWDSWKYTGMSVVGTFKVLFLLWGSQVESLALWFWKGEQSIWVHFSFKWRLLVFWTLPQPAELLLVLLFQLPLVALVWG